MRTRAKKTHPPEESYILLGERRDGLWLARAQWRAVGQATSVSFDWEKVLDREKRRADVIGFLHTHPGFSPEPSARDEMTMRAWCNCFGKPLIRAIASGKDIRAWLYRADEQPPETFARISCFRGKWIVASER